MKKWCVVLGVSILAGSLTGCLSKPDTAETTQQTAETTAQAAVETTGENNEKNAGEYTINEAAASEPSITLTMSDVNPLEGTICGAVDLKFKEAVEAMSGGTITIDLQGSGVLGAEADILDGMLGGTGTVDLIRIGANSLNNYSCTKSILTSLPYTFESRDHFYAFAASDVGQELLNEPEDLKIGVRGLFYGEEGTRNFFTVKNHPVKTPEDMKNLKIRSSSDPVMTGMIANLGATPSPVSFSEIYPSMQNGTIDGAEQPVANYKSNSFTEVGPNLTLDGHTLGVFEVLITDNAFDTKLAENQQQVLLDASKICADYCQQISGDKEAEVIEQLKAEGVNFIEVEDKTAWREACSPIVEEYTKGELGELYNKILSIK